MFRREGNLLSHDAMCQVPHPCPRHHGIVPQRGPVKKDQLEKKVQHSCEFLFVFIFWRLEILRYLSKDLMFEQCDPPRSHFVVDNYQYLLSCNTSSFHELSTLLALTLLHGVNRFEFSLNYATLPTKSKINSAKKLPPVGIEPRTFCNIIYCLSNCAKQTCVGKGISELNLARHTTSLFGLGSFLQSIEHDIIKLSKIQTDNQKSTWYS